MENFSSLNFEKIDKLSSGDFPSPYFDKKLKCWIIAKADDVLGVMRETNSHMPPLLELLRAIEKRFSIDLEHLRYAAEHNVLLINGDKHAKARRNIAELIAHRRAFIIQNLPQWIELFFQPFKTDNKIEIIEEAFLPLVNKIINSIAELNKPITFPILSVTRVFDRLSNLTSMKLANGEIGKLRRELANSSQYENYDARLSAIMLGRDSLLASLGASFAKILDNSAGKSVKNLDLSLPYPSTGVAASERILTCPANIGSHLFSEKSHMRIYFQSLNSQRNLSIFGAGHHACLGKQISLDVWNATRNYLKTIDRSIEKTSVTFARSNVFHMPMKIEVSLS